MKHCNAIFRLMDFISLEQQEAASFDLDLPLLISAAPGSGKTSVIAARVAFIQGRLPSHPIACISFTNVASKELRSRITSPPNVWCGTLHKLAIRVTTASTSFLKRLGTPNQIFKAFVAACKRHKVEFDEDNESSDDNTTPWEIAGNASRAFNTFTRQRETGVFADSATLAINSYFDEELDKLGISDLYTLMTTATRLLLNPSDELTSWLRENISFVLVDEAQDCSVQQWRFLHALTAGLKLTVVGDPNQQIFAFSGAAGFQSIFREIFPRGNICRLSLNFRSIPKIVNIACKIHAHSCVARNSQVDGFARIHLFPPGPAMLNFVASEITRMKKDFDLKNSDFAVLSRLNAAAQRTASALCAAGLRSGAAKISQTEEFVFAVFTLSGDPGNSKAFTACMNIPSFGLTAKIKDSMSLRNIHDNFSALALKKSELNKLRIFQETIIKVIDSVKRMKPREAVLHVLKTLHLSMSDSVIELLGDAAGCESLAELVEARSGKITVSTIHSSKGTEKEAVFVIDCDADVIPLEGCELNGERNVMYVAVTRARRFLWLLGSARRPSIFLEELMHK